MSKRTQPVMEPEDEIAQLRCDLHEARQALKRERKASIALFNRVCLAIYDFADARRIPTGLWRPLKGKR